MPPPPPPGPPRPPPPTPSPIPGPTPAPTPPSPADLAKAAELLAQAAAEMEAAKAAQPAWMAQLASGALSTADLVGTLGDDELSELVAGVEQAGAKAAAAASLAGKAAKLAHSDEASALKKEARAAQRTVRSPTLPSSPTALIPKPTSLSDARRVCGRRGTRRTRCGRRRRRVRRRGAGRCRRATPSRDGCPAPTAHSPVFAHLPTRLSPGVFVRAEAAGMFSRRRRGSGRGAQRSGTKKPATRPAEVLPKSSGSDPPGGGWGWAGCADGSVRRAAGGTKF